MSTSASDATKSANISLKWAAASVEQARAAIGEVNSSLKNSIALATSAKAAFNGIRNVAKISKEK